MNLKLTSFLCTFFCLCNAETGIINKALQAMGRCNKENPISTKELNTLISNHELPTSETGKCFFSCFLEDFGLISDGQIDLEKSFEFNKIQFHNPDDLKKANDMSETCKEEMSTSTEEGCDFAVAAASCMLTKSKEAGFNLLRVM